MGKWALFTLPFIVVLREGLEAVVFVGGVSLGQSASAIPIAAIVGKYAASSVASLSTHSPVVRVSTSES